MALEVSKDGLSWKVSQRLLTYTS